MSRGTTRTASLQCSVLPAVMSMQQRKAAECLQSPLLDLTQLKISPLHRLGSIMTSAIIAEHSATECVFYFQT